MSQETIDIMLKFNPYGIERPLIMQCAPVIAGIKTSNLLMLTKDNFTVLKELLECTELACICLYEADNRAAVLVYRKKLLCRYLKQNRVRQVLKDLGYQSFSFENLMKRFCDRYREYECGRNVFPHEIGIFLGYPVEDVCGFIEHDGKEYLYAGPWKVYGDVSKKRQLFCQFEVIKERLFQLLESGITMREILQICDRNQNERFAVG